VVPFSCSLKSAKDAERASVILAAEDVIVLVWIAFPPAFTIRFVAFVPFSVFADSAL